MTSSHHGPYVQGYTRTTMAGTIGCKAATLSQSQKAGPSSDCGLKLVHMKAESLVIANQKVAVNTFPGLVHTARHTTKVRCNRSGLTGFTYLGESSEAPKLWLMIGVKS